MNTSKQRAARNSAKVEFLACAEEAVSMLGKGFNKFNVYSELSKRGLLTMAYRSFCWNLQQFKNIKREKKRIEQPVPAVPAHRASTKKESFGQIEDVDANSLI